ncbi:MAG TPA: hypothetical protein VF796_25230, partial [Humisphaera sp.]
VTAFVVAPADAAGDRVAGTRGQVVARISPQGLPVADARLSLDAATGELAVRVVQVTPDQEPVLTAYARDRGGGPAGELWKRVPVDPAAATRPAATRPTGRAG